MLKNLLRISNLNIVYCNSNPNMTPIKFKQKNQVEKNVYLLFFIITISELRKLFFTVLQLLSILFICCEMYVCIPILKILIEYCQHNRCALSMSSYSYPYVIYMYLKYKYKEYVVRTVVHC